VYLWLKKFQSRDLDPFNEAGTTTKVAKKTGKRYLGIGASKAAEEGVNSAKSPTDS
jgi:DNA modification methylase